MFDSTNDSTKTMVDNTHQPLVDAVVKAVEGVDQPMEDQHPAVPAVLAIGTYPVVLAIAIAGALGYWFLYGW
jgi:nitrate reductase NapE component